MKLQGLLAGAAMTALAACGGGGSEQQAGVIPVLAVSDVMVTSDLGAVGSPEAATYWGNLDNDLESAIAAQFVGQTDPEGVRLLVDIDELSIADFFDTPATAADARLTGTVTLIDSRTGEALGLYTVSASAEQAMTRMGTDPGQRIEGTPATSSEFYTAVVQAFASGVATAVTTGGTQTPA